MAVLQTEGEARVIEELVVVDEPELEVIAPNDPKPVPGVPMISPDTRLGKWLSYLNYF